MDQTIKFDPELLNRYDKSGPRYTSYPTAVQFHNGFTDETYLRAADESNELKSVGENKAPLSLYFHLPFCNTVCFYCACNKVVTKDRSRAEPYLQRMHREIELQAQHFDNDRTVDQLHWGGGTPTFISHDEMRTLMDVTRKHFRLREDGSGEYSIEIDPREVSRESVKLLRDLGFNRMSLGVQDFDVTVQKAVNRIQSKEKTLEVLQDARDNGFKSISIDLIYGLPFQSVTSFSRTLDEIIEANPDRLSVFNYAHLPELFKPQRRINADELPAASEKLAILSHTIERLTDAGYVYIGMDHFAKPNDELAIAQRERSLYRNFQGYSTHAECDLVAFGITSIGMVGNTYEQNVKSIDEYYARIDSDRLAVYRGIELSHDDLVRRSVITDLICHFSLEFNKINTLYNLDFGRYFAQELQDLEQMQNDGLVKIESDKIEVEPAGRLLIRNICMVFDRYLRNQEAQRFSKVI